jgi:hypothetical protein
MLLVFSCVILVNLNYFSKLIATFIRITIANYVSWLFIDDEVAN